MRARFEAMAWTGTPVGGRRVRGVDSMVLLRLLADLRDDLDLRLHAVHIHHGLRSEADADARFVEASAEAFGVPCTVRRVYPRNERGVSSRTRSTLQERARRLRYRALGEVAREVGARGVATAHHADDQAETCCCVCSAGRVPMAPRRWCRNAPGHRSGTSPLRDRGRPLATPDTQPAGAGAPRPRSPATRGPPPRDRRIRRSRRRLMAGGQVQSRHALRPQPSPPRVVAGVASRLQSPPRHRPLPICGGTGGRTRVDSKPRRRGGRAPVPTLRWRDRGKTVPSRSTSRNGMSSPRRWRDGWCAGCSRKWVLGAMSQRRTWSACWRSSPEEGLVMRQRSSNSQGDWCSAWRAPAAPRPFALSGPALPPSAEC